jgi:hypothetical protein
MGTYLPEEGWSPGIASARGWFASQIEVLRFSASNPPRVDVRFLERFPEFLEFRALRHTQAVDSSCELMLLLPKKRWKKHTNGFG